MRDELRELSPGVLIGLGSMGAAGGMRNSAPFVLWPAAANGNAGANGGANGDRIGDRKDD